MNNTNRKKKIRQKKLKIILKGREALKNETISAGLLNEKCSHFLGRAAASSSLGFTTREKQ